MELLKEWLGTYTIISKEDLFHAKREIMQEIALAGMARGGFFQQASFYGGTALRVFYNIKRFSENLDFSLNFKDESFSIKKYIPHIINEFNILDLDVSMTIKEKKRLSAIESAFLKENTHWGILNVTAKGKNSSFPTVRIKIEIDRDPPLKFEFEPKLLLRPYSFYVNVMREEFLFAGKMHAVLFRQWRSRVKGREWYDFEWFVKRGTPLNLTHLKERSVESGHWDSNKDLNPKTFFDLLYEKISKLDIESAKNEIQRFIKDPNEVKIWSNNYFMNLSEFIKFSEPQ